MSTRKTRKTTAEEVKTEQTTTTAEEVKTEQTTTTAEEVKTEGKPGGIDLVEQPKKEERKPQSLSEVMLAKADKYRKLCFTEEERKTRSFDELHDDLVRLAKVYEIVKEYGTTAQKTADREALANAVKEYNNKTVEAEVERLASMAATDRPEMFREYFRTRRVIEGVRISPACEVVEASLPVDFTAIGKARKLSGEPISTKPDWKRRLNLFSYCLLRSDVSRIEAEKAADVADLREAINRAKEDFARAKEASKRKEAEDKRLFLEAKLEALIGSAGFEFAAMRKSIASDFDKWQNNYKTACAKAEKDGTEAPLDLYGTMDAPKGNSNRELKRMLKDVLNAIFPASFTTKQGVRFDSITTADLEAFRKWIVSPVKDGRRMTALQWKAAKSIALERALFDFAYTHYNGFNYRFDLGGKTEDAPTTARSEEKPTTEDKTTTATTEAA